MVPDPGEAGVDVPVQAGVNVVRLASYQPEEFVKVMDHHISNDTALMRRDGPIRQGDVPAQLEDVFDFADAASRDPAPDLTPHGIKAPVKSQYDWQAGPAHKVNCRLDGAAITGDGLFTQRRQTEIDGHRQIADMRVCR
ncbi:hypothetical protein AJ88_21690 [Mesorhizobium amorphae CCBAU 01583]|nr:hypothetical protein AJ88_21690 [Mesorhizobium amorphae CCBAU 01583]